MGGGRQDKRIEKIKVGRKGRYYKERRDVN